jgi:hypothetical protein
MSMKITSLGLGQGEGTRHHSGGMPAMCVPENSKIEALGWVSAAGA